MALRELSKKEYRSTFSDPMRRLGEKESYRPVPLKDYVKACIDALDLPTNTQEIEIHHVYLSGDEKHTHVLFYFGEPNRYLVVVVSHEADTVMGHYVLDLNEEYGVHAV